MFADQEEEPRPSGEILAADRVQLLSRLNHLLGADGEGCGPVYVFHCKLNDLIDLQYLHGRQAEHAWLQCLRVRASQLLAERDCLAQISAGSLVIVRCALTSLPEAIVFGQQLQHCLSEPLGWEGRTISTRVSIGITRSAFHNTDAEALLLQAQHASEQVPSDSGVRLFHPRTER